MNPFDAPVFAPALLVRRAWRGLSGYQRNVYIMLVFTLGKGLQLSIAASTVNLYAHSLGYDETFIGVLTAAPAIGALLASVPSGLFADRIGRKPLLLIGGLLNPLTLIAIGLTTSAPLMLLAAFANGVCANAYWVANFPILTESTREDQRVGVLAANNFLLLGVGALGSVIGGFVPELVGRMLSLPAASPIPLRWGVLVASFVTFAPSLPLFWLRESRAPATDVALENPAAGVSADAQATAPLSAGEDLERDPATRWGLVRLFAQLLLPDLLFTTGEAAAISLLALYFALRFHLSPGPLGVFLTIAGFVGGFMSFAAPRIVRRWGKLQTATTAQYLSVPVVLAMGFAPALFLSFPAELARNMLRGVFEPTYAAFAMEQVSSRYRATLSGFYSVTWSVGFSIGAVVTGWLQAHVSLSAAFVISAICIAASATCLRIFFGRGRLQPPTPIMPLAPDLAPSSR